MADINHINDPGKELPTYSYLAYDLGKSGSDGVYELRRPGQSSGGSDTSYELRTPDGIHFWHSCSSSITETAIELDNAAPFVQLSFSVTGTLIFENENQLTNVSLGSHEYNINYFSAGRHRIYRKAGEDAEAFGLNLAPELFGKYLPAGHFLRDRFAALLESEKLSALCDYNLPITPRINSLLYEILQCPLSDHYKRLYLRAKSVELLLTSFSHFEEYHPRALKNVYGLRPADISRMQQAREILHRNVQNPCTLIDLAHQVGTNENYLKKHFKQVYGHTVFGYVQELRMQDARRRLMEDGNDIHEVARRSGYKHTHHFVTAYKKHFGYEPVVFGNKR